MELFKERAPDLPAGSLSYNFLVNYFNLNLYWNIRKEEQHEVSSYLQYDGPGIKTEFFIE